MAERTYEGDPLDGTVQYLGEAPHWQDEDGETVAATDDEPEGDVTVEDVPMPQQGPDEPGQSTLDDWGWSV